jgi:hypothetical protein
MYDLRRARSAAASYSSAASAAAGCRSSKYSANGYAGHGSAASSSSYRPGRSYTSRAGFSSYYGHDDDGGDGFGSVF